METLNPAEAYILDLESKRVEAIKFFKNAIGELEIRKIVRDLHIESYKKLQAMKASLVNENDLMRAEGLSFKDRMAKLTPGKYEWIEGRLAKLAALGKNFSIPPFEAWVPSDAMDILASKKKNLAELVRFYYCLDYFV